MSSGLLIQFYFAFSYEFDLMSGFQSISSILSLFLMTWTYDLGYNCLARRKG